MDISKILNTICHSEAQFSPTINTSLLGTSPGYLHYFEAFENFTSCAKKDATESTPGFHPPPSTMAGATIPLLSNCFHNSESSPASARLYEDMAVMAPLYSTHIGREYAFIFLSQSRKHYS